MMNKSSIAEDPFYDNAEGNQGIPNQQPSDFGLYDYDISEPLPASGGSGPPGPSVTLGGATEDNQDINPTSPFSITINGSANAQGVQTSPMTIGCIGGTGEYPAQGTGSSPQSVNYPNASGISVSPGSGTTIYRVIAKVSATMTESNGINVSASGTIAIEEGTAVADKLGANTRYTNNGLDSYTFFFMIGTVTVSRRSDGKYAVKITQVQEGDYSYGNVNSSTAVAGGETVSTKDGLRKFTICINGEPFTCDIDVSNIVKVT